MKTVGCKELCFALAPLPWIQMILTVQNYNNEVCMSECT